MARSRASSNSASSRLGADRAARARRGAPTDPGSARTRPGTWIASLPARGEHAHERARPASATSTAPASRSSISARAAACIAARRGGVPPSSSSSSRTARGDRLDVLLTGASHAPSAAPPVGGRRLAGDARSGPRSLIARRRRHRGRLELDRPGVGRVAAGDRLRDRGHRRARLQQHLVELLLAGRTASRSRRPRRSSSRPGASRSCGSRCSDRRCRRAPK